MDKIQSTVPRHILPTIIFAQFAGTSLWFATNAIIPELQKEFALTTHAGSDITSAVQFGFILGTLVFALFGVADRFPSSKVFLYSAVIAALANVSVFLFAHSYGEILLYRFITGFFLAGIYPMGMKISADWYAKGLGKALGYLVGALVLGTAFPHLMKTFTETLPWATVLVATSLLATLGGVSIYFLVPDGPHRQASPPFSWSALPLIFKKKNFRRAAFGYFGHMWELYALWASVPALLYYYKDYRPEASFTISLWSGLIIAMGALGCVWGGYLSLRWGSQRIAMAMLVVSGLCCLVSPLLSALPLPLYLAVVLLWGLTVVGDSPQFSTLVAQNAPKAYKGTALTIVNSLGFAITIVSIQGLKWMSDLLPERYIYLLLFLGPLLGILSNWRRG